MDRRSTSWRLILSQEIPATDSDDNLRKDYCLITATLPTRFGTNNTNIAGLGPNNKTHQQNLRTFNCN